MDATNSTTLTIDTTATYSMVMVDGLWSIIKATPTTRKVVTTTRSAVKAVEMVDALNFAATGTV